MIRCIPSGICSWDYRLEGDQHSGEVRFRGLGEGGSLVADGQALAVNKGGWLSGEWTLAENGETVVVARKPSAFYRSFELSGPGGSWKLEALSAFARDMHLAGAGTDCRIEPVHAFTRRAFISGRFGDFRVVTFAFWLSALMWRRAASNNAG